MATPEIPDEILAKLIDQIIQDPGIPVENPTVSAWQEPAHPLAMTQSKDLPQYADFAIIGSGITGCSVAKSILESEVAHNKRVTVFEARSLTTGATSRNGGFLISHVPKYFKRYSNAFGADAAKKIAQFCDLTLKKISELAKVENLENESQMRDTTTIITFENEESFAEVTESIRMYEEAIPGARGEYTVINKQKAEKVMRPLRNFDKLLASSRLTHSTGL